MDKGQTSTEYIIIVAIVIIIAVVVSSIFGNFPGISSGTTKKVDDYKLTTSKVAVADYASISNYSLIKIKNNHFDTLTASAVNVNGEDCGDSSLPVTLGIGKSYILNCSVNFTGTPNINIIWEDSLTGARYATGENESSSEESSGYNSYVLLVDSSGNLITSFGSLWSDGISGDVSYSYSYYKDDVLVATTLIDENLISYWPFSHDAKDYYGSKDCTLQGDAQILNSYLNLDGDGDFANASDSGLITGDLPRSVSFKFRLNALEGVSFVSWGTYSTNQAMLLSTDWRIGREAPAWSQWGAVDVSAYKTNSADTWYHVVFTNSGSGNTKFYVNATDSGLQANEISYASNTVLGGEFLIGARMGPAKELDGSIDEVMIFDDVLTSTEVSQLYKASYHNGSKLDSSFVSSGRWIVEVCAYNATQKGNCYNSTEFVIS